MLGILPSKFMGSGMLGQGFIAVVMNIIGAIILLVSNDVKITALTFTGFLIIIMALLIFISIKFVQNDFVKFH